MVSISAKRHFLMLAKLGLTFAGSMS